MKDQHNNTSKIIRHYSYNGDVAAITLLIELIVFIIIILNSPNTDNGLIIQCGMLIASFISIGELFKYTLKHSYNSETIVVNKLGKYYMNQRSSIKNLKTGCAIDVLDKNLIGAVQKIVVTKEKDVYLTTHYHVIKLLRNHFKDTIKIEYKEDNFIIKDLKRLKKTLIKSCPQCSKCKNRQSCKLHKDQSVKMYNVKISLNL